MKTCKLIPTIKINGVEKESKLFDDLSKVLEKREDVKELWGLLQVDSFIEKYNLKKVNGECLINDVIKQMNLETVLENKLSRTFLKKQAGFINENKEIKIFKNYQDAIAKANEFNDTHGYHNAIIVKSPNGFSIDIQKRAISETALKQQVFQSELNFRLLNMLHQMGFDVSVIEGLQKNGIFNPLNAEKNTDGLIKLIEIAQGKRGEEALPEEFSHLIVAGLRNTPLIKRALDSLTEDQIKIVLGDQYEQYKKDYENDKQLLKEECLGKMLSNSLQENFKNDKLGLMQRIWNFIKSLFSNISTNKVNSNKNEAKRIADKIANEILNDDFNFDSIDRNEVFSSKMMYRLSENKSKIEEVAKEASKKARLWAKEKASKSTTGMYSEKDSELIHKMDKEIESNNYVSSCCTFLTYAVEELQGLQKSFKDQKQNIEENKIDLSDPGQVRTVCSIIVKLKNYLATYKDIIDELAALDENYDELGITEDSGKRIAELAQRFNTISTSVNKTINGLTMTAIKAFLRPYWKDKKVNTKFIKDQIVTVDLLLEKGFNDITFADSLVNAISESSDILLSLMAKISIHQQDLRDDDLLRDDAFIRECERKLREAGFNDTSVFFDKDENGKPTGWLISDRNSVAFEKAKQAEKDRLAADESINPRDKITKLQDWINNNTETIIKKYNGREIEVTVPKEFDKNGNLLYGYLKGQSPIDKLSPAQKEYYENMLSLKAAREEPLPKYKRNLYRAVQKRTDFMEELSRNISDPKELWDKGIEKLKDNFVRRTDDTEFGEFKLEGEKLVLLNARGKPIKQIPIYYLNPIEDMSQLSMDFGGSMRAYCATTLNYAMMNEILPQMELLNDIIQNRNVEIQSGGTILKSVQKIFGQDVEQVYTKQGKELRIGKAADFLMDKQFYGINKADENTIGKSNIDTAKLLDFIKSYTSLVGMGLNLYSGISNLTMGGMQMVIEASANEHFNFKDLAKAHLLYDKDILGCIAEMNSIKRENKLSLLIDKFDSLESFYDNIKSKAFYKNGALRAAKDINMLILNEIGEHRLHNVTMLAILNHHKLKQEDKEITLYDALEVSKEQINPDGTKEIVPPYIKIKDGVTNIDGTEFTQDDFIRIKREVSRTNRRLHGAYSEAFKGAINQKALGRLATQFRQWMFTFYSNRFAGIGNGAYHDVEIDESEEGYYVTMFKFTTSAMKDIAKMKFEFGTNWDNLTPHQKANMKRCLTEIGMFAMLDIAIGCMGKIKDKESTWSEKMLQYQMLRLQLEVGAGMPLHPDFFDNIWTMLQSPAAAIKSCNNVTDLLKFWNMFNEIQTGRYQGWSRYHKDFMECIPLYGQIRKVLDLKEENYMFNIYNQK